MNTKQTDKHILKNKAIWKSTYQEAYIAKKKKKKKKQNFGTQQITTNQPRK